MVMIKLTKEIHGPTLQYPVADLEGAQQAPSPPKIWLTVFPPPPPPFLKWDYLKKIRLR